jgi:putative ABC transport system permease protein
VGWTSATPWRRAPLLLWRHPVIWSAVAGAAAVLALVIAVPPYYLSAAASASVADQQRGRCLQSTGLQALGSGEALTPIPRTATEVAAKVLGNRGRIALSADGERGHLEPAVTTLMAGLAAVQPAVGRPFELTQSLLYRDNAEDHLDVLARVEGDGFLMTEQQARRAGVRPGGSVAVQVRTGPPAQARVVGVYRDLAAQPRRPFWCSLDSVIHLQDPFGNNVPPPLMIATSHRPLLALAQQIDPDRRVAARIERPLRPALRVDQVEDTVRVVDAALAEARSTPPDGLPQSPLIRSSVAFLVTRAQAVRDALTPPLHALSVVAALACLGLTALASAFWAARRKVELDVLHARGVSATALGVKAALECLLPLTVGLGIGAAGALLLVRFIGPEGDVPTSQALSGVRMVALALPALLLLVFATVALTRRPHTRRVRRGLTLPALVTVSVAGGTGCVLGLARLGPQPIADTSVQLPAFGVTRMLLPLCLLVLAAGAAAAGLRAVLPLGRGRGERLPVWLLLPVQRLAAAPGTTAAVALAVAVASGLTVYSSAMAASMNRTVEAKAKVFVGSDTAFELMGQQPVPETSAPLTRVLRLPDPVVGTRQVQVLAVDPTTFARAAYWQGAFSDRPLPDLMRALEKRVPGRTAALVIGSLPDGFTVQVPFNAGHLDIPVTAVDRPSSFPGLTRDPLVVVSADALRATEARTLQFATELLWVRGPGEAVQRQLVEEGVRIRYATTATSVSATPSLVGVLHTLEVVRALGVLVGALAVIGIAFHIDVRSRRRRLADALTGRMGLSRRTSWVSGWLELGAAAGSGVIIGTATGLALAVAVVPLLDPLPDTPPALLLVPAWRTVLVLVAAAAAVTALLARPRRTSTGDAGVLRAP